ncbi:glycine dehydrogenase [Grosmannia clavigera kw1407]|uniref:Glycine cleavage system P protein n=1 Tax=Grosmannia clavigera (strain kw1407 / UAMH 11150) TaxID=655863 RepID=F0XK97_GROCL|nr:glycine dehydrogenase [Grosmannia clavigera kw1407]EFX01922.1 glycine dehydrogenase [Grosmannia clavigera kw1407]
MLKRGLAASRLPGRLPGAAAVARLSGRRTTSRLPAIPWTCRRCSPRGVSTSAGSAAAVSWTTASAFAKSYPALDTFERRHIGPDESETEAMLKALSPPVASLDEFVAQVVPADILTERPLFPKAQSGPGDAVTRAITEALPEHKVLAEAQAVAAENVLARSFIGAGYYDTLVPEVIKLNVLDNPAWYTSYTPYQPEISQGRLESLLNFQTLVTDMTALPVANASLLDEGTAAAEAVTLSLNVLSTARSRRAGKTFVVSHLVHPQTLAVLRGRADGFGIKVDVRDVGAADFVSSGLAEIGEDLVGVLVQYPDTEGGVVDFRALAEGVHAHGGLLSCATDLLALTLLTPPGEWGADIAFGSAQRLGVPMGFGGPHAAFFAVADKYKRKMPGRLIGVSKDRLGGRALRLALQTREQHIRREKATSNVCTAQALLANMNALYAVYHGPGGLKAIAERAVRGARILQLAAEKLGLKVKAAPVFDTFVIRCANGQADQLLAVAEAHGCNLRKLSADEVGVSVDEAKSHDDLLALIGAFHAFAGIKTGLETFVHHLLVEADDMDDLDEMDEVPLIPEPFRRTSAYLTHPVFNSHHSETEMLRYIHHLQSKDLSLVHSMIPLGSCTMKLNGSVEMATLQMPGFAQLHPFVPRDQATGYGRLLGCLKDQLRDITGMDAVSLQPNSGAQGEFAGLRAIRRFHELRGDKSRDVCLIPVSAHGTNPASAAMAGLAVVPVRCDAKTGNLDLDDLEAKCAKYADRLAAIMITYPSTFGVFEPGVRQACDLVHAHGGQVYMDGANMNAQIGLCSPGDIGADVCHLNLHKTFCIPHGGGGPGSGPICVKEHLAVTLPPETDYFIADSEGTGTALPAVSSAPFGSASILPISWAYNLLMGGAGLKKATKLTLLNANYLLSRLQPHYPIVYTNARGRCAHEFILDLRPFHDSAGIEAIDVAKRLQDYGFHAPTMSWPVANTLMIEPTESESKAELDRFVDALVSIRAEIRDVEEGRAPRVGNVLKMAPHPIHDVVGAAWDRPYSAETAVYPLPYLREKKFWPSVARVDDTYGDLNLFCTCPPVVDTTGQE